jgi:hypothetical protein
VAETVALTLEQIAAQKEAADRDRQRQLEWAVVIQRQLDSGCAGDATLVPREGDRERQVERVMTSYDDGSFLIDRLAAGMVVDQDCAKSCQTCCRFLAPTATRQAQPLLDYYRLLIRCHTLRPFR